MTMSRMLNESLRGAGYHDSWHDGSPQGSGRKNGDGITVVFSKITKSGRNLVGQKWQEPGEPRAVASSASVNIFCSPAGYPDPQSFGFFLTCKPF